MSHSVAGTWCLALEASSKLSGQLFHSHAVLSSAKKVNVSPLMSCLEKVLSELTKQFPNSAENLYGNLGKVKGLR